MALSRYQTSYGGAGNYPGSSGYWADSPSGASGAGGAGGYDYNLGYPGDVARANMGQDVARIPSRYGVQYGTGTGTSGGGVGSGSLYKPLEIAKSPNLIGATGPLWEAFKEGSDAIPHFDDLLKEANSARGELKSRYQNEQGALDISGYAATQRGLDRNLGQLTDRYGNVARDIGGQYQESDANYAGDLGDITQKAYDILPQYDAAGRAIGDQQLAALRGQLDRYKIGGGNMGAGTDELRKIARGVANVELPLAQQKIQRQYDVLSGFERPAATEIATRAAQRLAQFELPMERDIYSRAYDVAMQQKQTESQIKQLEISTSGMSRGAAESYLRSLSLPNEVIQSVLQRHNQTLAGQIANAGGLGQLEDQSYYRGLEYLPGSPVVAPQYYNNALPQYAVPNRYSPPNTNTGTTQPSARAIAPSRYDMTTAGRPDLASAAANDYIYTPAGREDWRSTYGDRPIPRDYYTD